MIVHLLVCFFVVVTLGLTGTFKNVMSKIFGMKESDDCYHSASSNNVSNSKYRFSYVNL